MQNAYLILNVRKRYQKQILRVIKKVDYNVLDGNIEENNYKESKQFMNKKNISKNKNNRRNYDGLKYKAMENEDTDYSYI